MTVSKQKYIKLFINEDHALWDASNSAFIAQLTEDTKSVLLMNSYCVYCKKKPKSNLSPCRCYTARRSLIGPMYAMSNEHKKQLSTIMRMEKRRFNKKRDIDSQIHASPRQKLEKQADGYYRPKDIKIIFSLQKEKCYFCWKPINTDTSKSSEDLKNSKSCHKDHLKPLAKRGSHWPHNIALTCPYCNQLKNSLDEESFWSLLEEKHGEEWVNMRKEFANYNRKEKQKLTKALKAITKEREARRTQREAAEAARIRKSDLLSRKLRKKLGVRRIRKVI